MAQIYQKIDLPNGEVWQARSDNLGPPFVCIPIDTIDGMSVEEIGEHVLACVDWARGCLALQVAIRIGPDKDWSDWMTPELMALLEEFEGRSEQIDAALLTLRTQTPSSPSSPPGRQPSGPRGFVYLLKAGDYYKIGHTTDVSRRVTQIGLQMPWPITLVHSIPVSRMTWAERHLHSKFYSKRTNGEWFNLDDDDVRWICSLTQLEQEG